MRGALLQTTGSRSPAISSLTSLNFPRFFYSFFSNSLFKLSVNRIQRRLALFQPHTMEVHVAYALVAAGSHQGQPSRPPSQSGRAPWDLCFQSLFFFSFSSSTNNSVLSMIWKAQAKVGQARNMKPGGCHGFPLACFLSKRGIKNFIAVWKFTFLR